MGSVDRKSKNQVPVIKARGYVELLARSSFSFLQGASHPEEFVEEAIRLDYDGIGICDLHGLYGVVRGFQAAHSPSYFSASLKPKDHFRYVFGTELVLQTGESIILMPLNKSGYSRLCEIITKAKRDAKKGFVRAKLSDILYNSQDLIIFALPPWTDDFFVSLQEVFDDRLYLPIWRDLTWESQEFCKRAFELEEQYGAQLVVTQRPYMHHSDRKAVFDILTCIQHQCTLEEAKLKLIQNSERSLHSLPDLSWLWRDRIDLVDKSLDISARIQFSLDEIRYRYPESQIPIGKSKQDFFRIRVRDGLSKRFPISRYPNGPPVHILKTVEHEISLIFEMEYEDYFLTLCEICDFAQARSILYQGRGSAANSVVCYALGLTNVDPTEIDLLFERFISKERGEPPDIDIDFEHERREEVIQHIYQKYTEAHAAMVCTVIRYKSKMSFRETAKVFGLPLKKINSIIKYMGRDGLTRLLNEPTLWQKFSVDEDTWTWIVKMASALHGFPRHLGIHTGGFLITHDPINECVPVEKASMDGRYVIQWNKDDVATLKLMKVDVLSLGMLTALRKCLLILNQQYNIKMDLAQIPRADIATFDMICEADTVGVFQIESRAQMNTLPRLKPRNYYDLVVDVALVRPGPLQGGMVHPYLRRRQGLEKVEYAHKDLKPILEKTMGVPIFQEQVMKIAIHAAGFSPGEADELRRVMSSAWRKKSTMDGVRSRILGGLVEHGISNEYAEQIFKVIEGFANYGFPESHAASFALLTYASSYIKRHYPEVFVCALLNSQPMGFYPPRALIADAKRHGVETLPLSIQDSQFDYSLEDKKLRIGLSSIYSIPKQLLQNTIAERVRMGPFASLEDFIKRCRLPKTALVQLASAGALWQFQMDPRTLIWQIEGTSLDPHSFLWAHPRENFSEDSDENLDSQLPKESTWEEMEREYSTKGYSLELHPLSVLRSLLEERSTKLKTQGYVPYSSSLSLKSLKSKVKIRIAGLLGITQRPPTAKGFCFLTLEDEFGSINIVVPPTAYQTDRSHIYTQSLLEIWGEVEHSGPITNIRAERVIPLRP